MEAIYAPESFRASERINLKEYFEKYKTECYGNSQIFVSDEHEKNQSILSELNIDLDVVALNELEEACSINHLNNEDRCKYEPIDIPDKLTHTMKLDNYYPVTTEALKLECVKYREDIHKHVKNHNKKGIGSLLFNNHSHTPINFPQKTNAVKNIFPGSEFIVTIYVYKPMSINRGNNSSEKIRSSQEIEALGSNTLAEVADQIGCIADLGLYKEIENTDADLSEFVNAKEHYPSRSMFIDGVFYNDMRSPKAIDYSETCTEWAVQKGLGKFKSALMETTKISDLKPRLGYPYVYLHQGDCEHIIALSDVRLIQDCDLLSSELYPRVTIDKRRSNIMCYLCTFDYAKWIVTESDRYPQEKVFLCTECCNSYNYIDGKKVGHFKLYPFYDREMLSRYEEEVDTVDY